MLLNCGTGEDSWESLGLKEIKTINPKGNQSWIFIERTYAEAEVPIFWPPDARNWLIGKDPNTGKDWRQEDGWMASPTQWTWVWVNSGSWWWTGRPGVMQSMGPQSIRHNWVTELNWTDALLQASLVAQLVKNSPAVQETQNLPLSWEDPLEEGDNYPFQCSCLENPMDRGA